MATTTTAASTSTTGTSSTAATTPAPLDAYIAGYTPLAQPKLADIPFTIQGTP
jgi:hypothetical protein